MSDIITQHFNTMPTSKKKSLWKYRLIIISIIMQYEYIFSTITKQNNTMVRYGFDPPSLGTTGVYALRERFINKYRFLLEM